MKVKSETRLSIERAIYEVDVLKMLKKKLKLWRFSKRYRKFKRDLRYFDTPLLDVISLDMIRTKKDFENTVNGYIRMEYTMLDITEQPMEYKLGEAKKIFAKLAHDSKNHREGEPLFVGS